MKNSTFFALLLSSFLCTSVSAQIDTLFSFPYKKEMQEIARVDGQQISIIRFTEGSKKTNYCKMEMSNYSNPSNSGDVVFNKENLSLFIELINKAYVKSGSEQAKTYTELVSGIRDKGIYLKIALVGNKGEGWKLFFDRSPYASITPIKFNLAKLPELNKALSICLSQM